LIEKKEKVYWQNKNDNKNLALSEKTQMYVGNKHKGKETKTDYNIIL
jgi:hypothetical protein